MGWLTNWDDLIHGTAVFGAAVPFFVALILAAWQRHRAWIALSGAVAIPLLWLFGLPELPPKTSDNTLVPAWILATGLIVLDTFLKPSLKWRINPGVRLVVWTGLAWSIYPAWLADTGGSGKHLLIALAVGASVTAWSFLIGFIVHEEQATQNRRFQITPASLVPPTVALSVLLQFGGSTQFAQSTGALASAITAVSIIYLWKPKVAGLGPAAAFWSMLFGLLAWSGWLFAEIHVLAAVALIFAPLAALITNVLTRGKTKHPRLLEILSSLVISGLVIWAGWARYSDSQTGY